MDGWNVLKCIIHQYKIYQQVLFVILYLGKAL